MDKILCVEGLTKRYDSFTLDNITFSVEKGSIVGLIGENGAGKTTIFNLIVNAIRKSSGTISVFGLDSVDDEVEIKKRISYTSDSLGFPEVYTIKMGEKVMRGIYKNWRGERFFGYLEKFGLEPRQQISKLSRGMKMKLIIAIAFSHGAELLLLDEPTSGLDPVVREEVLDILRDFVSDGEHTVILSSHIISDIDKAADYVLFIHRGRIVFYEDIETVASRYRILRFTRDAYARLTREDRAKLLAVRTVAYEIDALTAGHEGIGDCVSERASMEEIMLMIIKNELEGKSV